MHSIIQKALKVMESEFKQGTDKLNSSKLTVDYCRLQLGMEKDEVFAVLFMDNHFKMLSFEIFFRGTVNQSGVFMRPIARKMLELNAAKMILVHNHPSGDTTPSNADINITREFKKIFDALDCQVVDHIIVSSTGSYSMMEKGISI